MAETVVCALLWFSAIGCGLIAGLYFAFSTFILQALDRLGAERGAEAMNAINVRILRSLFMPLFLGTTLTSLALVVIGLVRSGPGEAVFENPEHDYPQRVGYRRIGTDSVLAWIDGTNNGTQQRVEFPYRRVPCPAAP